MSSSELRILKTLETLEFKENTGTKHNLTIPHDWLVKRVFVYIIKTGICDMPLITGFKGMSNR